MDSSEEYEPTQSWQGVPATVILINIFQNSSHNTFAISHDATCRLVRHYLRISSLQNVSVCIYGIVDSDGPLFETKSLVEIIKLSTPTLDDYKKLKNIDIDSYKEAKELTLSDVLWHVSKTFTNSKRRLSSKTVIVITPLHISPTESDKKLTLSRIEDLVDSNIDVRLVNVSEGGLPPDPFYEKFLIKANKGMGYVIPKPVLDSIQIEKMMLQESYRHLAVAKLNFKIGDDMAIGVGVYSLLKMTGLNRHKVTKLDRESNAIIESSTKTVKVCINKETEDSDSEPKQEPLKKSELLYYQEYGNERIEFSASEMESIRNPFGPPTMKLLGFKPASLMCKEKWFLKKCYFLYPNESIIEGSTTAFKAFHKACNDMRVVAICVLCTRINARPIIVALNPCTNPLNLNVEIGFDVIQIPFVENVRDININDEDDESIEIDKGNKMLMRDIINQLKFDYKPDMFENPKLQSEYRALEEIALDKDVEPFIDTTKPKTDKFRDIEDDLFEELFGPFGVSQKRTATQRLIEKKKKPNIDFDEDLLLDRVSHQGVGKYTVQELKNILKAKNLKDLPALTGLKKQDLVELVYKYCT